MTPVELYDVQGALILRARGSELLILQHFIAELKKLEEPKSFAQFFLHTALVNRPARKLFEAWLRKDRTLWNRIFQKVHKEMEVSEEAQKAQSETPVVDEEKPKTEKKAAEAKAEVAEKESAPAKKKATKKASKKTASAKDSSEVKQKTTTKKKKASTTKVAEAAPKKKAAGSKKAEATTKKTSTAKKTTTAKKKSASSKKKS